MAALQKAQRREEWLNRARRIGIWVVVGIVLFIVANLVFGGGSSDAAAVLHMI